MMYPINLTNPMGKSSDPLSMYNGDHITVSLRT